MRRRTFLKAAMSTTILQTSAFAGRVSGGGMGMSNLLASVAAAPPQSAQKPMALGLMIQPATGAEAATSVEVVGPGRLVWDFLDGPSTIGLVPPATRAARMDALKQTSDFAKMLGVPRVQTHCGFIPENPRDPLYGETVEAIRAVADHCAANGQDFLMETGQETPTTMKRAIEDVNRPNLGVGLDTANLILYGKANPVDAVSMIGPHVKSVHAKDGKWPTGPMKLGEEVLIGTGCVDFPAVFEKLHKLGYGGAITIEREISGPQQIEDVKKEKAYLERVIAQVLANQA